MDGSIDELSVHDAGQFQCETADRSPVRRALRAYFQSFQGLTGGRAPLDSDTPIYKDTASGAQV